MNRCCIALGANLDNPERAFDLACERLEQSGVTLLQRSSLLRTAPMGTDAGPEFLNAAALVQTDLSAAALLSLLHQIEDQAGRTRTTVWGPRPLDLDLLLFDDLVVESPQLTVPHPLMWFRRFVLEPLNEVAPHWPHPLLQETTAELLARLSARPIILHVPGFSEQQAQSLQRELEQSLSAHQPTPFAVQTHQKTPSLPTFAAVDLSACASVGRQPPQQRGRILRPFQASLPPDELLPRLAAFLHDVLTAVLPTVS
ncbi:MAG: 2-amino-4-hydroxy-6-hydroxymethyldihydropteridine diphosphokinase [Planctomycetaceae bacterium]|nr:2-amino-4-hydroxy-6-hydroxymethyldihydropteridine diphosphokinase [Planctomycetaceae bacterium]